MQDPDEPSQAADSQTGQDWVGCADRCGIVCGRCLSGAQDREEPPKVNGETTAIASRGFLEAYIEGDGEIQARTQVELGKELKGKVTEVLVQAGQAVKAGDKLFTVDPTEIREELDTARKDMQEAQRALDEAASGVTAARKRWQN